MSNKKSETAYIVTKSEILYGVRHALECDFAKTAIVDLLMINVENEIETILEDDCDEMTDEMWEILSL